MAEEDPQPNVPAQTVESVKLTPIEMAAITDHINRKAVAPNDACPVCGSPNNVVLDDVYRLSVLLQGLAIGGEHQPIVTTVCNNCGFVRLFNRLVIDRVVQAEIGMPEPPPSAPDDGG